VAIGSVGVVVPGLPTTVFFIVAAACFSRSSSRFEQWVLTRPYVGPMVRDYRAGLGMPHRAKVAAIASIVVVCGLSAFVARGRWWLSLVIVGAGAVGVAWIRWRVPTRADDGHDTGGTVSTRRPRAPRPPIAVAFMVVAFAEACSWIGLLIGMYGKYIGDAGEHGVEVFGRIHGIVVLAYVAVALLAARRLRWDGRTTVLALLASVPPLATLVFERWAARSGRLDARVAAHP
jgi:integral membrane protein